MFKHITRKRLRLKRRGRKVCDNSERGWIESDEENGMMEGSTVSLATVS